MRTLLAISVLWAAAVPFLLCTLASASERPKKITTVEGITEYRARKWPAASALSRQLAPQGRQ